VSIRKTGQVTGQVTEVEQPGLAKTAARDDAGLDILWRDEDEAGLAAETERE
jgi:hypothetical protein